MWRAALIEYVSCLAYKLNAFGFSADAALEFIRQEFPDYERPTAAVDSCYRQTEEHGKRKHELQSRHHLGGQVGFRERHHQVSGASTWN